LAKLIALSIALSYVSIRTLSVEQIHFIKMFFSMFKAQLKKVELLTANPQMFITGCWVTSWSDVYLWTLCYIRICHK